MHVCYVNSVLYVQEVLVLVDCVVVSKFVYLIRADHNRNYRTTSKFRPTFYLLHCYSYLSCINNNIVKVYLRYNQGDTRERPLPGG